MKIRTMVLTMVLFLSCKEQPNRAGFIRFKSGKGESWGKGFTHSKKLDDSTFLLWRHVEAPDTCYNDTAWIDYWERPEPQNNPYE